MPMSTEDILNLFQNEVKMLLTGYLDSEDTVDYLSFKIRRLHEEYSGLEGDSNEEN